MTTKMSLATLSNAGLAALSAARVSLPRIPFIAPRARHVCIMLQDARLITNAERGGEGRGTEEGEKEERKEGGK